jgi:hypothetical protein
VIIIIILGRRRKESKEDSIFSIASVTGCPKKNVEEFSTFCMKIDGHKTTFHKQKKVKIIAAS